MSEVRESAAPERVQEHLREIQVLLDKQHLVENLVHKQEMPRHELVESLVWAGVLGFFGLLFLMFVRLILAARNNLIADYQGDPNDQYVEYARGPLGIHCIVPGPPTATVGAVDFADEDFELFAKNRRTFTFTNVDVATA